MTTDRAILDGALAVLAEQGMRGLTHRAVDTAAGLPAGSTSYYFRSRAALVAGCVERLVERDLAQDVATAEAAVLSAGRTCPPVWSTRSRHRGAHGDRRAAVGHSPATSSASPASVTRRCGRSSSAAAT